MGNGGESTPALSFGRLAESDLPGCTEIAATAPDPWRLEDLAAALGSQTQFAFVARTEHEAPAAFAVFCAPPGGDTADLQLVAVAPEWRKKGVACALLTHCFGELACTGVRRVLLELRCSNTPAERLYASLGFLEIARRPGMYAHPREDGLLLGRSIAQFDNTEEETE